MKNKNLMSLYTGIFVLLFLGISGNMQGQQAQKQHEKATQTHKASIKVSTLSVNGMYCSACVDKVQKAATNVKGVKKVDVSLKENQAEVEYNGDEMVLKNIVKAIQDAGYGAKVMPKSGAESS